VLPAIYCNLQLAAGGVKDRQAARRDSDRQPERLRGSENRAKRGIRPFVGLSLEQQNWRKKYSKLQLLFQKIAVCLLALRELIPRHRRR
jgi:hypothetical protein